MPILKLALDRSARRVDVDGRLHVDRSHISKANVCVYYGNEIPGWEALGLDGSKVYRLLRDPVELERAAPTFARLPILSKHVPVTVDTPQPDLIVGAIGSDVAFAAPYLDADLCVWDAKAIAGIETEQIIELSCAYRYVPVMEAGEFEGQAYDGKMTEIQGNHLALVEVGRAGADVVVADANPFTYKESAMKTTKLGKALFAALCAASPVLAADSALPALVGLANRKNFDTAGVKAKLMALDATLDPQQLDRVIDALLDVEQPEEPTAVAPMAGAGDEGPCDKVKAMLAGKVDDATIEQICALIAPPAAEDEFPEKKEELGMKKEEVKAAMDGLRKDLRDAEEARRDVRPVVGDVSTSIDSAAEVYAFALDQMTVDHKDVEGTPALRALFRVAHAAKGRDITPHIAQDADAMAKQFPGAARFRNA